MMSLLRFTILIIFGMVSSQNPAVNSQIPFGERPVRRSVEATTVIPPDHNVGVQVLLSRIEYLCLEKLDYLITDTNSRFQSLENKLAQSSSCPAPQGVQNNANLEAKVENLDKDIQVLMNATRNLSSNETATSKFCPQNITLGKQYPRNCREVRESGETASGTYMIQPDRAPKPFQAVCDLETRGGNWTVIQRRFDGSQDFYLEWEDYKKGFGNLSGEFWLGLDNIHLLTVSERNELLVELGDFESNNKTAYYSWFTVGSEFEGYELQILDYSGDAGDSLSPHGGCKFSTKDVDQDNWDSISCADRHRGAWWYNRCFTSNLNGQYYDRDENPESKQFVISWDKFDYMYKVLKYTKMSVRPKVSTNP